MKNFKVTLAATRSGGHPIEKVVEGASFMHDPNGGTLFIANADGEWIATFAKGQWIAVEEISAEAAASVGRPSFA